VGLRIIIRRLFPALVGAAKALIFFRRPIPQAASYHDFADQRIFFGVPNFWCVVSNIPFLVVGVWGLLVVGTTSWIDTLITPPERWAYAVFFLGVTLTSVGSG